jgi:diaminopimelate decarboxylase
MQDMAICRMLATAGCGFDCASQAEIEQVKFLAVI